MLFSACGPEQIEINHQKEKGGRIRESPNNNKYGLTSRLTHNRLANQLPLNLPSCFRLALDQVDTDFLPVFHLYSEIHNYQVICIIYHSFLNML